MKNGRGTRLGGAGRGAAARGAAVAAGFFGRAGDRPADGPAAARRRRRGSAAGRVWGVGEVVQDFVHQPFDCGSGFSEIKKSNDVELYMFEHSETSPLR